MTETRFPVLPTAILLFALGFGGRIALHDYHNFETVMVSVFLAAMLLPTVMSLLVTLSIMIFSDLYLGYFGTSKILFFTYTGFILVSFITSKFKDKIGGEVSAGTMYKFTSSGIIFALVYDTLTNFGVFLINYNHTIDNLFLVYGFIDSYSFNTSDIGELFFVNVLNFNKSCFCLKTIFKLGLKKN